MKYLQTDIGKEYYNSVVQALLTRYGVKHYSTYSEKKASIVEHFNRTLKTRLYRAFSEQCHYRWLTLLHELLKAYKDTVHRTIGMKPRQVNELTVLSNNNNNNKKRKNKFKLGDRVRVSKYIMTFAKGYTDPDERDIHCVQRAAYRTRYLPVERPHGWRVEGWFYEQELSKTNVGDVYLVEEILQRKGDRVRVRWLGFDDKYDSWTHNRKLM